MSLACKTYTSIILRLLRNAVLQVWVEVLKLHNWKLIRVFTAFPKGPIHISNAASKGWKGLPPYGTLFAYIFTFQGSNVLTFKNTPSIHASGCLVAHVENWRWLSKDLECFAPTAIQNSAPFRSCPKPLELIGHFIHMFTNAGQLIFNPFCGTAPVVTQCALQGRFAFGLDIDEHCVRDGAATRIGFTRNAALACLDKWDLFEAMDQADPRFRAVATRWNQMKLKALTFHRSHGVLLSTDAGDDDSGALTSTPHRGKRQSIRTLPVPSPHPAKARKSSARSAAADGVFLSLEEQPASTDNPTRKDKAPTPPASAGVAAASAASTPASPPRATHPHTVGSPSSLAAEEQEASASADQQQRFRFLLEAQGELVRCTTFCFDLPIGASVEEHQEQCQSMQ